jgi:hypothetical protein
LNEYSVVDARGFQAAGMGTGACLGWDPEQSIGEGDDEEVIDFVKLFTTIGGFSLPIMMDIAVESSDGWAALAKDAGDLRSNLVTATGAHVGMRVTPDFYDALPGCPWGWDIWLAGPATTRRLRAGPVCSRGSAQGPCGVSLAASAWTSGAEGSDQLVLSGRQTFDCPRDVIVKILPTDTNQVGRVDGAPFFLGRGLIIRGSFDGGKMSLWGASAGTGL